MITNKELEDKDYVNLDAAKALKEIGYNIPTHTRYHVRNGQTTIGISSKPESWLEYEDVFDRPILQKAVEYLREKRCVSLRINKSLLKGQWFYDYLDLVDGSYLDSDDYYDDYNKAINDGICEICNYIKQDSRH